MKSGYTSSWHSVRRHSGLLHTWPAMPCLPSSPSPFATWWNLKWCKVLPSPLPLSLGTTVFSCTIFGSSVGLTMFYLSHLKQYSLPYTVETGALHFDTDANLCALQYIPAIAQQTQFRVRKCQTVAQGIPVTTPQVNITCCANWANYNHILFRNITN